MWLKGGGSFLVGGKIFRSGHFSAVKLKHENNKFTFTKATTLQTGIFNLAFPANIVRGMFGTICPHSTHSNAGSRCLYYLAADDAQYIRGFQLASLSNRQVCVLEL